MDKTLKKKLDTFCRFCRKNNLPVFTATWSADEPKNSGYVYGAHIPSSLNKTLDEYGVQNKFPLFLKAAKGEWKGGDDFE